MAAMCSEPTPNTEDRDFQVWEYQVGHGTLLVRSPKGPAGPRSPERTTNVDIVFVAVEYLSLPSSMRGLTLEQPTRQDLEGLASQLGRTPDRADVCILQSQGRRFAVVGKLVAVRENDWDIYESPIEFRSQFRGSTS